MSDKEKEVEASLMKEGANKILELIHKVEQLEIEGAETLQALGEQRHQLDLCEQRIADYQGAIVDVLEWWRDEGKGRFLGAPACIFNLDKVLDKWAVSNNPKEAKEDEGK